MGNESFLRKTTEAAIVAGALATTGASSLEKTQNPDMNALYIQTTTDSYALRRETFDYSLYSESAAKKAMPLIRAIEDTEREHNAAYGLAFGEDPSFAKYLPARESLENLRKKLYTSVRSVFSDLPPYSEPQFYKTMVSLPRRFSSLGVSVVSGVYADRVNDVSYDVFVRFTPFRPVLGKEKVSEIFFGHAITTHSLMIGPPLGTDNTLILDDAHAAFGNFFVYSDTGDDIVKTWADAGKIARETVAEHEAYFGGVPAQQPYRNDYVVNTAIADLASSSQAPTPEQHRYSIRAHELGHILNHQDKEYQDSFTFDEHSREAPDSHQLHMLSHEELDGILTDLRYGNDDVSMLKFLISLVSDNETGEPTYHYGARWIYTELASIIAKDPGKYEMTIQDDSPYSIDEQVLLALPRSMRDRPAVLDAAWEDLWHLHRTRLTERLYTNSLLHVSAPAEQQQPPQQKKEDQMPITQIIIAGVGVFATLLAAQQARKYRQKVQKEQAALQSKIEHVREVIEELENGQTLFLDLQIGVKTKLVDNVRRDQAHATITDLARKSPKVRKIYQTLKELIDIE
jgi:hypothetical protein